MKRVSALLISLLITIAGYQIEAQNSRITASSLPDLPDDIGVAGPVVGVHNGFLIVAGGANFARPDDAQLWALPKVYHDRVWTMRLPENETEHCEWEPETSFRLSQTVGYSSVVSTPFGVLCLGGENELGPTNRTFYLRLADDGNGLVEDDASVPDLPESCTGGGAALIDGFVYVVAGQVLQSDGNRKASRLIWRIALNTINPDSEPDEPVRWQAVASWPREGPPRTFSLVTSQHDGFGNRLFVLGGRHVPEGLDASDPRNLKFGNDCWSFDPASFDPAKYDTVTGIYDGPNPWKRIADAPVPVSAGTAVPFGPAHIIVPAYASGDVLAQQLNSGIPMSEFQHPGFPKRVLAYHTVTDTWTTIGEMPSAQVTTPAVRWNDEIILVSGEVRPRVRSSKAWCVTIPSESHDFGWLNLSIVVTYLLAMLGVGFWFSRRNKTTDDYFRGGKSIPWWVAGCSIFATMLSSITYMAVPAKAFAQDWVYAVGNLLILGVAPIAAFVALPFFRRIDATSAYEYLEKRFSRGIRWIGSGSFSLFHVFRIGVVLALAALALSSITSWSPAQCVIVMGVLSIVYCTLGGIEAVVWTDTLQTFILLGGALACLAFALTGAERGSFDAAVESGKFHLVNLDFGSLSFTTMAIWVVILGGLGQNVASYTADQTVVQRYMTTPDQKLAARSIWLNGLMAIPAGLIFFGMGTAFWMFYRSNPDKLDPSMAADKIMPLFISQELPVGLAGLVVAGIFAAAQSTVSTSMNSAATTIVTDFFRPLKLCKTERTYLRSAQVITLLMGVAGTSAGLLFVDPDIKSLFDEFIGILGMFLGVLAGLFALGVTTRRANAKGSLTGAVVAIAVMVSIVLAARDKTLLGVDFRSLYDATGVPVYRVNGYLYAFVGIVICFIVGYLASWFFAKPQQSLDGLTLNRKSDRQAAPRDSNAPTSEKQ